MLHTGGCGLKAVKDGVTVGYTVWNKPGWRYEVAADDNGEAVETTRDYVMALECQMARCEGLKGEDHWYV